MRSPGDNSKLVFSSTRCPFVLVHPKVSKRKNSHIPKSLDEFLSLGDHEKPWRLMLSGDESLLRKYQPPINIVEKQHFISFFLKLKIYVNL